MQKMLSIIPEIFRSAKIPFHFVFALLPKFFNLLIFSIILSIYGFTGLPPNDVNAEESDAYYDFGVFDYEEGNYEQAEKNFIEALKSDPDNPFYNHYLGKTYLKMGQNDENKYQEAMKYLNNAWESDPEIPSLKYDMAFLNYKLSFYSKAAILFKEVVNEEPSNVLAHYYTGINLYRLDTEASYKEAIDYFIRAGEKSPTIRANGYYYAGVCLQKTGQSEKAIEMFEYVRDHADSALAENARQWLEAIQKYRISLKSYSLYLKIGFRYDDNIQLEPLDMDIYTEEDDYAIVGYASGKYNFINRNDWKIGLGYSHYQSWYDKLKEYELTGSLFNLYIKYQKYPFIFGFSYLPSYYWLESDSYLRQHRFRPEIIWNISGNLATRVSYTYDDDEYFQDSDSSGHTNEVTGGIYYQILDKAMLFGEIGYEDNAASVADESYDQLKTRLGISLNMPWDLMLNLTGKYYAKKYDEQREDDKYIGSVSLSRNLFYDWLGGTVEFDYTKNDSNLAERTYKRKMVTISLTVRY